eukprot:6179385-Pleurochrysis_carterae.AAC.1
MAVDARGAERMVRASSNSRPWSADTRSSRSAPRPVPVPPPSMASKARVLCNPRQLMSACLRMRLSTRSSISLLVERGVGAP